MSVKIDATLKTIREGCVASYDSVFDEQTRTLREVVWKPNVGLGQHEIMMATWNVCEQALHRKNLKELFFEKIKNVQPKLFVMAMQEVDSVFLKTISTPNQTKDLEVFDSFFRKFFPEYMRFKNSLVRGNNQIMIVYFRKEAVVFHKIQSKILTHNHLRTKGAIAIALKYSVVSDIHACRSVCLISAHLRPHTDLNENASSADKVPARPRTYLHFKQRIEDMYNLLHACDRWYKRKFHVTTCDFLPFNIILEGDLNFRTIKRNTNNPHDDEGRIILHEFDFHEKQAWENFPYTFKINLDSASNKPIYNVKRNRAWTDRISFHNHAESNLNFSQSSYGVLDTLTRHSDHFPVFSTFDVHSTSFTMHPLEIHSTCHNTDALSDMTTDICTDAGDSPGYDRSQFGASPRLGSFDLQASHYDDISDYRNNTRASHSKSRHDAWSTE